MDIKHPGYQSQTRIISRTHSMLAVLDIMGAYFLSGLPLLGLLSDGAWKYDPTEFHIKLEPENSETETPSPMLVGY